MPAQTKQKSGTRPLTHVVSCIKGFDNGRAGRKAASLLVINRRILAIEGYTKTFAIEG